MKQWFVLLLFACWSCNDQPANTAKPAENDTAAKRSQKDTTPVNNQPAAQKGFEDRITESLMKLSFVQEANRHLDSITKHKHGISFIFDTLNDHIDVKAGYNGTDRFETYYNFTVDPKTFVIKVMDAVSGDELSIEDFMKLDKKADK